MYEILGWPLSDPVACETPGTSRERQTSRAVCVGLIQVLRLRQIGPCIGQTSCFRSNWVFRGVTPVGHSNLKTYRTDHRERCRKTIPFRVDPVERYWLLYQRILGDPFQVLVAQERSLSFTDGRPDELSSSFTLMYFGKRRASRINLFWSRWILLMIVSEVVMVEREPYSKIGRTHCL